MDVAAGDRAVDLMRAHVESTRRPEVAGGLGGFGGAIGIPAGYREPLLVASTDGVGTKTAIAAALGRFDTIGIDLVAMCADDVVCCGAEPLAFLDYVAVGHVVPEWVGELVGSVAAGCRDAGCALIGGETAEHPGLMEPDEFDLSGCCIGVVERADVIDGSAIRAGDAIVGLAASGLHSNGFSLVRTLIAQWDLDLAEPYQARLRRSLGDAEAEAAVAAAPSEAMATLGEILLTPTRIYARTVLAARAAAAIRRPRRPRHRPHHRWRPARQRATRAARTVSRLASTRVAGGCRRSCACSGRSADSTTRSSGPPSTAASGWSWSCQPAAAATVDRRCRRARDRGDGRRRGDRRGRRPAHAMSKERWSRSGERPGTDRGRRVGRGVEPARARGRGRRAARSVATIVLVFADRACPALDWAIEQGIETALVPGGDDATLAETLAAVGPDVVVLAGYMRIVGPAVLAAFAGRILNTHPSLLPAFPGAHAVADALAHGVTVTGCTVHLVDETLDGGPIVAQEAVAVMRGDDAERLHERIRAVEHRLLPRAVGLRAGRRHRGRAGWAASRARRRHRRRGRAGAAAGAAVRVGQDRARAVRARARRGRVRAGVDRRARRGRSARPACRSPMWPP